MPPGFGPARSLIIATYRYRIWRFEGPRLSHDSQLTTCSNAARHQHRTSLPPGREPTCLLQWMRTTPASIGMRAQQTQNPIGAGSAFSGVPRERGDEPRAWHRVERRVRGVSAHWSTSRERARWQNTTQGGPLRQYKPKWPHTFRISCREAMTAAFTPLSLTVGSDSNSSVAHLPILIPLSRLLTRSAITIGRGNETQMTCKRRRPSCG